MGKLRKSGTERKTLIHLRLDGVHHLRKVTTSPLGDFLVDGVALVNLLSPAQEKAGEAPLFLAYLVCKAWWWTQLQKMARLCDTFQLSLLQALHHGHLKDRGTNRFRLNSQPHTRWSLSKCSSQHAFPEMCANPKELHLPAGYWIAFSVHEATDDLLLHLKPARTGMWSYGNQGITLTELLWRYWAEHHRRFGRFQLHTQPVTQFHFRKMQNN